MSEQLIDVKKHSPHSLSATKILRLAALVWVGLSFVVIHFYDVGQVGDSMQWKDGKTRRPSNRVQTKQGYGNVYFCIAKLLG